MGDRGVLTFLFSDVEGSTRLWESAPQAMATALARHDELVRWAIERAGGAVFKTVGDAFCAVFGSAADAVAAAVAAQRVLAAESWPESTRIRVRIGVHSGPCVQRDGDFFGPTVNRVARLEAIAHGGQTVLSAAVVESVRGAWPPGVHVVDCGDHRLKDLDCPERVFEVVGDGLLSGFPPLRSLDNPLLRNNLPRLASSFVGRQREVGDIRGLVEAGRLVTLVGVGGSGKTRLALQVAADLVDGAGDGVWLVELASVVKPELVTGAVAGVVGVREEPGRPLHETLVEALAVRDLLVVLDNCEHVLGVTADLVDRLVRSCPGVHILATSREPLGLDGETVYRVAPLSLPPPGTVDPAGLLAESEAVRLFVERAGAQGGGFVLDDANALAVASICRRLDGIPLALELASARLRSLSVADIEARLDDRFRLLTGGSKTVMPRQQTLLAAMEWSEDLLAEPERVLLRRCSVFAGGWNLAAAEAVAAVESEVDVVDIVDLLTSLVDKSLVEADTTGHSVRYRLLETVRHYAAARFGEAGPDALAAVRAAHAQHYLAFAETAAEHLAQADQRQWLERLDADHGNLRAALTALADDPDAAIDHLRLAAALGGMWTARCLYAEGADALTAALSRPANQPDDAVTIRGLSALGVMQYRTGNYQSAHDHLTRAATLARQHGDPGATSDVLRQLGFVACQQGDLERANALLDEAVELATAAGNDDVLGASLNTRAAVRDLLGRAEEAAADSALALLFSKAAGNHLRVGGIHTNSAYRLLRVGQLDEARQHAEDGLAIARQFHDHYGVAFSALNLGLVAMNQRDVAAAATSFSEALASSLQTDQQSPLAYSLLGLAVCATEQGDQELASTLHGVADHLFERLRETPQPLEADLRRASENRLRAAMGNEAFNLCYERGAGLRLEEALHFLGGAERNIGAPRPA